jgi:hypothetical protein
MQELIVTLVVIFAFFAVLRRYLPRRIRVAIARMVAGWARSAGWTVVATRLEAGTRHAASCSDGCGSCGGCGSEAPPKQDMAAIPVTIVKRAPR